MTCLTWHLSLLSICLFVFFVTLNRKPRQHVPESNYDWRVLVSPGKQGDRSRDIAEPGSHSSVKLAPPSSPTSCQIIIFLCAKCADQLLRINLCGWDQSLESIYLHGASHGEPRTKSQQTVFGAWGFCCVSWGFWVLYRSIEKRSLWKCRGALGMSTNKPVFEMLFSSLTPGSSHTLDDFSADGGTLHWGSAVCSIERSLFIPRLPTAPPRQHICHYPSNM